MRIFLKLFSESISFALQALRANKLRTLLSLLGITIGIFSIIAVFTATDALENKMRADVASLGNSVVYVEKWPWLFGDNYPWWKFVNRPLVNQKEMTELNRKLNTSGAIAFVAYINGQVVKYESNAVENVTVLPISYEYNKIKNFELVSGRYFTESEVIAGRPVAILGDDVSSSLFPNGDAMDKTITIKGKKLTVIGTMKREGKSMVENSSDDKVMIPLNYARSLVNLRSENFGPQILVKAKEGITLTEMKDELRGAMRGVRRLQPSQDDNFALNEASLITNGLQSMFDTIGIIGIFIGGLSTVVGAFGIANIMFVSVRERTSIIGIQKSLGAKNYFILLQFLVESILLCLMGALVGLILIFFLSLLANSSFGGDGFNFTLTLNNLSLGLVIASITGLVSGFIPAYMAAHLDPVEAIRSNG